jgi:predicted helicase
MLGFYEDQRKALAEGKIKELSTDETKISWTANLLKDAKQNNTILFNESAFITSEYRPYCKLHLYNDRQLIERPGQWRSMFPTPELTNYVICVSGGNNGLSALIADCIPNLHFNGDSQCFPLYWYQENINREENLFDEETGDKYIRRDGVTDWILKEVRTRYKACNITKEMIFYYVYGLLHSEDYRQRFAADLKKSLPRIPIVENLNDFMAFSQFGRKLADLHLNYEQVKPCPGVVVRGDRPLAGDASDYDYYRVVDKMRFRSKEDKSTIIYNGHITIEQIPAQAYDYVVNGKSAIEWIVERYCVSQDKKSLIRNDANDWAREHQQPRYILDLLLSVINVSVQTVEIVKALPRLKFD